MTDETDNASLSLPPIFRPAPVDGDALAAAETMAADGADPGTFVWSRRDDVADCAIVLSPSEPLAPSLLVAYVAMVAVGDALGALIPPVIPVGFGWPDRIVVNGAQAGGIRIRAAATGGAESVPDWMVAGVTLILRAAARDDEPGRDTLRTSLDMEGCGDLTVRDLLESFARHFLYWMNRWQDDGFAPVRLAWLERAAGYGARNAGMETAGPWSPRTLLALEADGAVEFEENGKKTTRPLADILDRPTWSP